MKHKCHLQTPIGIVCIEEDNGSVTALFVDNEYEEGYYLCRSDEKMRFLDEPGTAVLKKKRFFSAPFACGDKVSETGVGGITVHSLRTDQKLRRDRCADWKSKGMQGSRGSKQ